MQNPPILHGGLENADLFLMSGRASWCFLILTGRADYKNPLANETELQQLNRNYKGLCSILNTSIKVKTAH